jgi:hypothetical protein
MCFNVSCVWSYVRLQGLFETGMGRAFAWFSSQHLVGFLDENQTKNAVNSNSFFYKWLLIGWEESRKPSRMGGETSVEKNKYFLWINARIKQLIGIIRLTGPKINDYYSLKILLRTKTVQIHGWWVMPRHLCATLSKQQCKPKRIEWFIEAHAQIAHVLPSPTPEFKFKKMWSPIWSAKTSFCQTR